LREDPSVFFSNLPHDWFLKVSREDAPGVGFNLEVRAEFRMGSTVIKEISDMIFCRSEGRFWFCIQRNVKMHSSFLLSVGHECRISDLRKSFRKVRKIQMGSVSGGYQLMEVGRFVILRNCLKGAGCVEVEGERIGKVNFGNA
tara:strand:+ start:814 stop:1242 length:429 start_codon:yes stop_codon:yes gene_type:complete